MRRLIAILLAAAALAACGAQPDQSTPSASPAPITGVSVELLESDPVQVVAHIRGELGNGCMSLGAISQRREGNRVELSVPALHSGAEACTMQLQLIDQRVQLEGGFAPGDYVLIVNGVETPFSV